MPYGVENYVGYNYASTFAKLNNAKDLDGLSEDVQIALGVKADAGGEKARVKGICCGITTSWMIAVLGGVPEATDVFKFRPFFEVLRFQGAYMKAEQGDAKGNLADVFMAKMYLAGLPPSCRLVRQAGEVTDVTNGSIFPQPGTTWACYGGLYGHAIGMAEVNRKFYLMDPNYGLFCYTSRIGMLTALQRVITARIEKIKGELAAGTGRAGKPTTGMLFLYVPV